VNSIHLLLQEMLDLVQCKQIGGVCVKTAVGIKGVLNLPIGKYIGADAVASATSATLR